MEDHVIWYNMFYIELFRNLSPKKNAPGILWIHGGGYMYGMKEMVHMSRAVDLVKKG